MKFVPHGDPQVASSYEPDNVDLAVRSKLSSRISRVGDAGADLSFSHEGDVSYFGSKFIGNTLSLRASLVNKFLKTPCDHDH